MGLSEAKRSLVSSNGGKGASKAVNGLVVGGTILYNTRQIAGTHNGRTNLKTMPRDASDSEP